MHDTFVSMDDHRIPFEMKFEKIGNTYLNGFVEDQVLIPYFYNDGKTRIITHELDVTKRVYVKDSVN